MKRRIIISGSIICIFILLSMEGLHAIELNDSNQKGIISPNASLKDTYQDTNLPAHNSKMNEIKNATEYYALIAGCSEYKNKMNNIPRLRPFPAYTMKYVSNVFMNSSNWKEENIIILLNSDATKKNILNMFEMFSRKVDSNDIFIFHWMGHGAKISDKSNDETDGYDEVICPYDTGIDNQGYTNIITDDELNKYLSMINANGQVIIIESCLSGGIVEHEPKNNTDFSDVNQDGRVVIMSTPPGKLGYSMRHFAWPISYLYSYCLSDQTCDTNNDSWISAEEAFNKLDTIYSNIEKQLFLEYINKTIPLAVLFNFMLINKILKCVTNKPLMRLAISTLWSLISYKIYQQEEYKQQLLTIMYLQLQMYSAENNPNMIDNYPGDLNLIRIM